MKDFLNSVSLKSKMIASVIIVALFFFTIFISIIINFNSIRDINQYQNSIKQLKTSIVELENLKNLTKNELTDNTNFNDADDNKYLTQYKDKNAQIAIRIDKLRENSLTEELELKSLINELSAEFKNNKKLLDELFSLIQDKGDENNGLLGQLASTTAILQKKINGHEYENKVILLIELMKNYIVTTNKQYLYRFNNLYADVAANMNFDAGVFENLTNDSIKTNLELANTSTISDSLIVEEIDILEDTVEVETLDRSANIPSNNRLEEEIFGISGNKDVYVIRQLNNMKNQFADVVALNYEIGLTNNEGIKAVIGRSFNRLNILLNDIESVAETNKNEEFRNVLWFFVIQLLIYVPIIAVIGVLLIRFVVHRLSDLNDLFSVLSKGKIPETTAIKYLENLDKAIYKNISNVIDGLREKQQFVDNIIENKSKSEFKPLSDNDALGNSLIELRQNLKQTKEAEDKLKTEESERKWITVGITRFADILRQSANNLSELGYNIIYELVKYMNINQGGIFYLNDEDKDDVHLSLLASYAYDRRKFKKRRIEINEGMLGMVVREKKITHLKNVPDDYITVTSGLGQSTPQNLLIVPLIFEDNIYGVIELAAFDEFKPHEIEFVEKVSENIATTLSTMKINIRTAKLLEQSKEQSEAMQLQEEELRQNLEELLATNEEMERKERLNINFRNALNKAAFIMQLDFSGNVYMANGLVSEVTKIDVNDLEDSNISELDDFNLVTMEELEKAKKTIRNGIAYKTNVVKNINGRKMNLLTVFSPLETENENEENLRLLFIGIDIVGIEINNLL